MIGINILTTEVQGHRGPCTNKKISAGKSELVGRRDGHYRGGDRRFQSIKMGGKGDAGKRHRAGRVVLGEGKKGRHESQLLEGKKRMGHFYRRQRGSL